VNIQTAAFVPSDSLDLHAFGTPIHQSGVPIIQKINKAIEEKRPFYSFEYFPPKTPDGVKNLYGRLDRMSTLEVSTALHGTSAVQTSNL
jgi:hypothetical protein